MGRAFTTEVTENTERNKKNLCGLCALCGESLFDENARDPKHEHACNNSAENVAWHGLLDIIPLDHPPDLNRNLEDRTSANGKEENREEW